MPESADEPPATDPPQHAGWFAWLTDLDFLLYGLLGLALLGFIIYEVGRALWSTGSQLLIAAFLAALAGTLASIIRDLRRRQLSWASRGFLVVWGLCVAVILVAELTS